MGTQFVGWCGIRLVGLCMVDMQAGQLGHSQRVVERDLGQRISQEGGVCVRKDEGDMRGQQRPEVERLCVCVEGGGRGGESVEEGEGEAQGSRTKEKGGLHAIRITGAPAPSLASGKILCPPTHPAREVICVGGAPKVLLRCIAALVEGGHVGQHIVRRLLAQPGEHRNSSTQKT